MDKKKLVDEVRLMDFEAYVFQVVELAALRERARIRLECPPLVRFILRRKGF